jgi:hypothetical protein
LHKHFPGTCHKTRVFIKACSTFEQADFMIANGLGEFKSRITDIHNETILQKGNEAEFHCDNRI